MILKVDNTYYSYICLSLIEFKQYFGLSLSSDVQCSFLFFDKMCKLILH